jgi:hypothetical protein
VSTGDTKKFATLLKKLRSTYGKSLPPPSEVASSPLDELVFSMMLWESDSVAAKASRQRLSASLVDLNELRVCAIDDLANIIGATYPLARERAMRLRCVLADIVTHFHSPTLDPVLAMPKRDAKHFLEALDGMPPFVAQRISLLVMRTHALPVDERLLTMLVEAKVIQQGTDCQHASSWLEHNVPSDDAVDVVALLQAWSDHQGRTPARPAPSELVASLAVHAAPVSRRVKARASGSTRASPKPKATDVSARAKTKPPATRTNTPKPESSAKPTQPAKKSKGDATKRA